MEEINGNLIHLIQLFVRRKLVWTIVIFYLYFAPAGRLLYILLYYIYYVEGINKYQKYHMELYL